jgi:hypothetical protein
MDCQFHDVGILAVVDLVLDHGDGALVVLDHPFDE